MLVETGWGYRIFWDENERLAEYTNILVELDGTRLDG